MKKTIAFGTMCLVLNSCASSTRMDYKPKTPEEPFGFEERLENDGSYIVSVVLPGADSTLPFAFWDRRAAEICGDDNYEKNIYKAERPTVVTQGMYVHGGVGFGGGSAGAFSLEGKLTCAPASDIANDSPAK